MGRAPCCEKVGLKKGRWTSEEDGILIDYIQAHGEGSWRSLPQNAGLLRCGKSCRLRWLNYLRADVKRGNISSQEEDLIIRLHASLGNRWSLIAGHLPGRTDNEIKNYWNSRLSRRIQNFNSPRNKVMPTAFVNLSNFITGTCRRRRGRTGAKDIKPPSTTIQHVELSSYRNGFDEMLGGQLEEQSVLSWPSEESTNAIKVCSSHQGSFESELMSLDDILGSGVSRHNEEIDKVDQGNVSVGCSNYYQNAMSHETDRDVTNMHRSNGVLLPRCTKTESGGLLCAANSSAISEEWADWTRDCSFQDQRMLDEEEMLSWLRDGSNA